MRKVKIIVVFSILICTFLSCSNGFLKDPRLYNPKRNLSTMTVAPEPELQLTGGVDPFDDTEKWYNKSNSNGDENNPEKTGFDASEFNEIQIAGWFDKQNVPTYTMTKGDVWKAGDATKHEYVHSNAPNTSGQGYNITGVTYYQYRGINPNYDPVGNYNTSLQTTEDGKPKLSRFYFYRFTGYGGSIQWLDNYLIAVDTYSKLIFAFSEPVEFSTMGAPTRWDPTDNEAFIGQMYQFYMYDPVGYVLKENGTYTVQLYQWFQDSLAKGVYEPTLGGVDRNSKGTPLGEVASKKPDGAGKSPFNNHTADFFVENMKLLGKSKIEFLRRETTSNGDGLVLYTYTVSEDGKTITRRAESWNGLPTDTDLTEKTYTIGVGDTATKGAVTGECVGTVELKDESLTLSFSNGEVARSGFKDPGPAFIERVKHNPTYELGVTKYVFSNGGKTLEMTWKPLVGPIKTETFTYQKQESNSQARYSGYLVQLYSHDNDIRCSTVDSVAVGVSVMEYLAHLKMEVGESFRKTVASKIFGVREKDTENLYSETLHSIVFSSNGQTATIKKTVYNGSEESSTVSVDDGDSGKQGRVNNQSVTLTEKDGSYQLTYEGKTYVYNYNDPGPAFIYRVRGKTYEGSGYTYVFSEDGKTITSGADTYTYSNQDANDRAVYQRDNRPWYEKGLPYWGLRLDNNDQTLYWSSSPWGSPATTPTDGVTSSPATRR